VDYTTGESSRIQDVPIRGFDKERTSPACGLATNDQGERLAVYAGGAVTIQSDPTDEVLMYNVDRQIWQPGPSLPYEERDAKGLQYGDSFLFIGKDDIFAFNPSGSGSWDSIGFDYGPDVGYFEPVTATLVPRSYIDCED